jgi:hypothetical protein
VLAPDADVKWIRRVPATPLRARFAGSENDLLRGQDDVWPGQRVSHVRRRRPARLQRLLVEIRHETPGLPPYGEVTEVLRTTGGR